MGGGEEGESVKIQLRRVNTRCIACSDIVVKTNSPKEDDQRHHQGAGRGRGDIYITDTYALKG